MYLIKNIRFNEQTKNVEVEDGIRVYLIKIGNYMVGTDNFWGRTDIQIGDDVDFSKLPEHGEMDRLLSYVTGYEVEDYGDNYKKFYFNVSTYEPEKKDGYIIFVKFGQNIETNGKKIFGRYPTEIVVVLKEGEYLKFDGKKVQVINKQLVLYI